jgi:predicted ATPase/DNA-binding SARP family transcriptional activator
MVSFRPALARAFDAALLGDVYRLWPGALKSLKEALSRARGRFRAGYPGRLGLCGSLGSGLGGLMLRIGVLGPMRLSDGDTELPVPSPMPRALLALLALRPGSPVTMDEIVDGLWGDTPPESARNVVQVYVSSLRRVLGRDLFSSGPAGYGLDAAVQVDAVEFEHGLRAGSPGAGDPAVAAETLGRALGLWQGEPLADVAAPFVDVQRTRLAELRLSVVEARADAMLGCGRYEELIAELEGWIARYPLRELLWAQLITALDRSGRQADALAAYQRVRTVLREELGADPGEQVQRAHQDVLTRPRAAAAQLPPGAAVPAPHAALIGRTSDIGGIRALLARPGVRLVTVLGPGGVGKTRLVMDVAQAEAETRRLHSDGVAWVPLASLTEVPALPATLAHALGIGEEPGRDASEALLAGLRPRRMLLVLDNLEHLLPGAALLLAQLLDTCPGLILMVTSRVATRVSGEHRFVLDPLPVYGSDGSGIRSDATVLLLERAEAARPGWAEGPQALRCAAALAADLDGLPLALELAAARASLLGPCALRKRLGGKLAGLNAASADTAARHRSLHAAITWSYELLPPQARQVLCQLTVFRGSIALDAAASVSQLDEGELLEQLTTLIDASLLQSLRDDPPSFRLLETIRVFAAERLVDDDGEMDAQFRHAEFFRSLGESAAPHLFKQQQQEWFDRLGREHDNLRAALQFWLSHGQPGAALRLATSLAPFWEAHGHLEEGLGWLGQALAAAEDADPAVRGWAMFWGCRLADLHGEVTEASVMLEESLPLFRLGGDRQGEIFALSHLGNAAAERGELSAAFALGADSVERARELGDPWYLAMALNNLGYNHVMSGDTDSETEKLLAESLQLRRNLHEKRGVGHTLGSIAELHLLRGDLEAAATTLEEMLSLSSDLTHAELASIALNLQGFLSLAHRDPAQAAGLFQDSLQRSHSLGFQFLAAEALLGLAEVAAQQGAFTRALRFEVVASRALAAAGQPARLHRSAIDRIQRHLEQVLDQATQQAITAAAKTVNLDQVIAEIPTETKR